MHDKNSHKPLGPVKGDAALIFSYNHKVTFKEKILIKPISLHRHCFSFSLACPYQAYGPQVGPGHSDLGYSPRPLSDS